MNITLHQLTPLKLVGIVFGTCVLATSAIRLWNKIMSGNDIRLIKIELKKTELELIKAQNFIDQHYYKLASTTIDEYVNHAKQEWTTYRNTYGPVM